MSKMPVVISRRNLVWSVTLTGDGKILVRFSGDGDPAVDVVLSISTARNLAAAIQTQLDQLTWDDEA